MLQVVTNKLMFLNSLCTQKVHGKDNAFIVIEPLKFQDGTITYTVPTGFRTDLSTWYLEGRHTPSAVLHDFLLTEKVMPRKEADAIMIRAMRSAGENVRWINVCAVTIGITIGRWVSYL